LQSPGTDALNNEQREVAFAAARKVLTFVSTFDTPPTPEVYEVWYRFVEGSNKDIVDQLTFAVNVAKVVTTKQLMDLRTQFLTSSDQQEMSQQVSLELRDEIGELQSIITSQRSSGLEFVGTLETVSQKLSDEQVSPDELSNCVLRIVESTEKMQRSISDTDSKLLEAKNQVDVLRKSLVHFHQAMLTDPLTGVGNRRKFDNLMLKIDQFRQSDFAFLFLLDLDNFKVINDTHGHLAGDDALRFVAIALKELIENSTVVRFGGDEFAVFVSVQHPDTAIDLANKICQHFACSQVSEFVGKLSVSIGAAILRADDTSDSWFERADKLLISAKKGGKHGAMVERKHSAS